SRSRSSIVLLKKSPASRRASIAPRLPALRSHARPMLTVVCGLAFGIAFGLTGVGSVFAVPMLVYALGLGPHQSVCVAMVSVSSLSALTTALRWRGGQIEFRAGAVLATMGILGAPLGAWIGRFVSGKWLMVI